MGELISTPNTDDLILDDFLRSETKFPNGILVTGRETPNSRLRRTSMVPVGEQVLMALIEKDDAMAAEILAEEETSRINR